MLTAVHSVPFEFQLQEYDIYDHVRWLSHGLIVVVFYISATCYVISLLPVVCLEHMLQMCTAFIYMPEYCSWLWPFPPVFNMNTHESFSKRTNASLSSAPSGPVT